MYNNILIVLFAVWSTRLTAAETIVIEGGNDYFNPSSVNASIGDVIEFHFLPNNHSVVMGDLSSPCQPAATGGFYSGFLPTKDGQNAQVFQVTINDTNPMVFYCSQNASSHNHCKAGMFGFVNQPDQAAIDAYSSAAKEGEINISPDSDAFGGSFATNSNTTAAANTTGTSDTPTTTETDASSSTNTGSPPNDSGAGVKASGLFAIAMALMLV